MASRGHTGTRSQPKSMDQGTRTRSRSLGSSQRRAASSNPNVTSISASLPASAHAPSLGLEPEVKELLLNRPAGLEVFLEGLGIQTCSDIRHMWSSGQAPVGEFEARSGKLSADQAFSVAALWTLALSRATTQGHKGIAAIVEDRTSTGPGPRLC